ncbi:MAG: hypothetical protein EPN93_14365 [Spirochaetes bacterium]|nr:MAG: hypothetical protein EPN93_14365 [Spirochaetota bacterium]
MHESVLKAAIAAIILASLCGSLFAQELVLPKPRMTAGIIAGAGLIGEGAGAAPDESRAAEYSGKKSGGYLYELGFMFERRFWRAGDDYTVVTLSLGFGGGAYEMYRDANNTRDPVYNNDFRALVFSAVFRYGGQFVAESWRVGDGAARPAPIGIDIGAGISGDLYLHGPFGSRTGNWAPGGRGVNLRPLVALRLFRLWERIHWTILEGRVDVRSQEQPQKDFLDDIFTPVTILTSIGVNF